MILRMKRGGGFLSRKWDSRGWSLTICHATMKQEISLKLLILLRFSEMQ